MVSLCPPSVTYKGTNGQAQPFSSINDAAEHSTNNFFENSKCWTSSATQDKVDCSCGNRGWTCPVPGNEETQCTMQPRSEYASTPQHLAPPQADCRYSNHNSSEEGKIATPFPNLRNHIPNRAQSPKTDQAPPNLPVHLPPVQWNDNQQSYKRHQQRDTGYQ